MTNVEFYKLQLKIREAQYNLLTLQDQYRKQTGVNFIPGQGIDDPKMCEDCRYWEEDLRDLSKHFCNCEVSEYYETDTTDGCGEWSEKDGSSLY